MLVTRPVGAVLADGHEEVAVGVGRRRAGVEPVEDAVALGRDVDERRSGPASGFGWREER